ncbi:hypothetical protein ACFSC6_05775 [Rufibacter sediminis]|uniref:DUF748 domain-containing protein n=1 Tax=Rufibacter sediminis TaxID=2762756 RepID=A0ABR6VQ05_9BACT|nr:hypothetical protein [Rufibacter sediminis]MBC3539281.1 hypothetical protein [Rufibacter sediminis]
MARGKKYLVAGGSVLLVVLVLLLIVSQNLDSWAEEKVKKQVHTQSKGVYELQMAGLDISLLAGSATLDSVRLTPNAAVWQQVQRQSPSQASASLSEVTSSQVQVRGIPFLKLLFGGAFGLSSIHLDNLEWELRKMKEDTSSKPLHEEVGKQFREMAIREIRIKNGTFRYHDSPNRKTPAFSVAGVDLQAEGVQLDSASFRDPDRAYYSKKITASAAQASWVLPDGNYRLKSEKLQASTQAREVTLARLQLLPLRSAAEMSRREGVAVTRFNVQVPAVTMSKVDFGTLFRNSNVYIGTLVVQKPRVQAYKDGRNYPTKGSGLMPHDLVQKLTFGVNIRTTKVRDLYVRYEELAEKAFKTGYVTGSNIDLTLTNLTNDKNLISRKKPAVLRGSGWLMGKAQLQATVRMALLDPNGYHSMEGTIGKGYPAILNPMVEPSMFVRVKSGILQRGSFNIELTNTSAQGSIQLQYDDFKIDLLNKEKERKQGLKSKLKTLVANKLVLKSESEDDGKAPRQGKIQVNRRTERSFLTYWKDCLANGVLSVIGAPM